MIATGLTIFVGVALILFKLPRRWMLQALNHDVALDLLVSALVLVIHWGTITGTLAAAVAGLMTSLATSGAKRLFGYIDGQGFYVPGIFHLDVEGSHRLTSR